MKQSCPIKIYVISIVAIILWGLSYIWSDRLIQLGVAVEYFVFVRVLCAGLILLLFNLLTRRRIRIRRKDLTRFLLLSFCEPLIYFICETYGIDLTESATYSALVIASTPIVAVSAGIVLFKEKMRLVNFIGIAVCLAGLVLVTVCADSIGEHFVWGLILLIVAVFAEVGHASFTKSLSNDYQPLVIVMWQFLIGAAYLFPLFLARGLREYEPALYLSWDVWRPIFCLAVLCSAAAFSLWVTSIKYLGVGRSSVFQAMIPVVTALVGFILGTEILCWNQWAGIAIAMTGVVMTQLGQRVR
ncbi:MAG: DMT family transporter [Bacteroidales bacterium]|nr:DMT family transporter [Bacteroidales bacterium]